ncbi:uncharacterized protein PAC_05749 [Phialocephala subalpina]|uniref:Uncharacterized protein n=1 Tax=Phialocephala subalpina TaxID=576137 RepID=A0A1L7WSW2_9HELO|nr:uncharacterized protein PAC_05749 [Phialocephala subalpina]
MAACSKPKRNWTAEVTEGRVDALQSIFIAVMGVTGAGKSSFISLCSDEVVEVGHDLTAHTSEVDVFSFKYNATTTVYLIDTPGFDDTNRSDTEVLQDLAAFLTRSYSNNIKLNGIIYLHRITDKLCGKDALKNVILATTMWSNVTPEKGTERESQLLSTPEFWGWMKAQGSTVRRHMGDRRSAVKIIDYFVNQKSHVTLEIQDQMVNQNKNLDQTSAGQELQSELLREREKFKADLEQVQRDMQEAIKERDAMAEEALKEVRDEYRSKIEELSKQGEELKISMQKLHEANYKELRDRMIDQVESHRRKINTAAGRREHVEEELEELTITPTPSSGLSQKPSPLLTVPPSSLPHQDEASYSSSTSRDQPKQEPLKFKDAVGRKFTFPFHLCEQWAVDSHFSSVLRHQLTMTRAWKNSSNNAFSTWLF